MIKSSYVHALTSVSLLSLFAASAAAAQTSPAPSAQSSTNETEPTDIVVTGVRASLDRAQEIKRNAPTVVEAISSEDLGKFTDAGVADALQRVPGVQVDRNARGLQAGSGVTIRGLGPDFVTNTINGRSVLGNPEFNGGGSGRNLDYDSINPETISGVLIYKSAQANLIEPGLAGEVDIQTLKPLDFKTQGGRTTFGAVSVQGSRSDNKSRIGARFSAIAGTKLLDNTLGIYVAGVYANEYQNLQNFYAFPGVRDLNVRNSDGSITAIKNVFAPFEADSISTRREYRRRGLSGGAQYRPTPELEINVDAMYNKFTTDLGTMTFQNFTGGSAFPGGNTVPANSVVIRDGAIVSFDTSKIPGFAGSVVGGGPGRIVNENVNYGAGGNIKYTGDKIKITLDYSRSLARYNQDYQGAGTNTFSDRLVNGIYSYASDSPATTIVGPNNPSNAALYDLSTTGFYQQQLQWRSSRDAMRGDVAWTPVDAVTVKAGVRYEATKVRSVVAAAYNLFLPGQTAYSIRGLFTGGQTALPGLPGGFPTMSYNNFCATNLGVCTRSNYKKGSFAGDFPASGAGDPTDVLALSPDNSIGVNEKTLSFYGEADVKSEIAGVEVSYNFGLRALHVAENAKAFRAVRQTLANSAGVSAPGTVDQTVLVTDRNDYWKALPSVNIIVKPTDKINLRFGYAKTVSLPGYFALAPRGSVLTVLPNPILPGVTEPNQFNGGNTRLKPTKADNFDATAEVYLPYRGALITSFFYKDVKDFVTNLTQLGVSVPGRTERFNSTTPVNAGAGFSYGFEVGVNQPFAFLPGVLDGLGVTANYTQVISKVSLATDNGVIRSTLPGTSKHNVNATGYYEKGGFGFRLAYAYRSDYVAAVGSIPVGNNVVDRDFVKGYSTVDISVSQKFLKRFEVVASVINLTKTDQIHVNGAARLLQSVNPFQRTFTLALRAKL